MKKVVLGLLTLSLVGCTDKVMLISNNEQSEEPVLETSETETTTSNILVTYYSGTGNTKEVADYIATTLEADTFVITPSQEYTSDDLNYNDDNSRVVQEHNDTSLQDVELAQVTPDNWESYDTVFVGYPIWWGEASWVVTSFVKQNDFTNKKVIPFCTSVSSQLANSASNLASAAGSGEWDEGMRFSSSFNEATVQDWLTALGY